MENPILTILREQDANRPEMSRKAGISYQTIYYLSTGLTRDPKHVTFKKLAKFGKKDVKKLKADWQAWKESVEQD